MTDPTAPPPLMAVPNAADSSSAARSKVSDRASKRSISDEQRVQVLNLHASGAARNAIARVIGIGTGSVSRIVAAAGGNFDRTQTEQATRAKVADVRAQRAQASADLLDDVAYARTVLRGQDEPRELMFASKAVSSLVFAHGRLAELDKGATAAEETAGVLAQLGDELRLIHSAPTEEPAA